MERESAYDTETFEDYVHWQLGMFSPSELAMYFVEGTPDKSIHPSLADANRDRLMILDYVGRRPEDFQDNFKRELERIFMPSVSLTSPKNRWYMPVRLRATYEDGSEEILEFPDAFFN